MWGAGHAGMRAPLARDPSSTSASPCRPSAVIPFRTCRRTRHEDALRRGSLGVAGSPARRRRFRRPRRAALGRRRAGDVASPARGGSLPRARVRGRCRAGSAPVRRALRRRDRSGARANADPRRSRGRGEAAGPQCRPPVRRGIGPSSGRSPADAGRPRSAPKPILGLAQVTRAERREP